MGGYGIFGERKYEYFSTIWYLLKLFYYMYSIVVQVKMCHILELLQAIH